MRRIIKFLQEVRAEFRNISWPKKDTLFQLTFVVISITIITSLILGGFDYLFTSGIGLLGSALRPTQNTTTPQSLLPTPTQVVSTTTPSNVPTLKK